MGVDISVIWFAIIVFATLMYIIMDGFDLGIGLLFNFVGDAKERDVMVNSVAPVWDGNETWLVLTAGALLAMFPVAFSILYSALYLPVYIMLLSLIVRGMAIEFRPHAPRLFDAMLVSGSLPTAPAPGGGGGAPGGGGGGEGAPPLPVAAIA